MFSYCSYMPSASFKTDLYELYRKVIFYSVHPNPPQVNIALPPPWTISWPTISKQHLKERKIKKDTMPLSVSCTKHRRIKLWTLTTADDSLKWKIIKYQFLTNFTFMLPCVVIDFFLNNQQEALIIQIYSCRFFDDRFQADLGWNAVPS